MSQPSHISASHRLNDHRSADAAAPLLIFSWGYWGWGTTTKQFVLAADRVEAARGFEPPLFVDVRISRSVRARGFAGSAFERTVGASRYVWMPALGNRTVREGGVGIEIDNPSAADGLPDFALERVKRRQRVLFFCSCEYPGLEHSDGCHRTAVGRLLLQAATRRRVALGVVEWPGGDPLEDIVIEVSREAARRVARGNRSIILGDAVPLHRSASLPWYSVATVQAKGNDDPPQRFLSGPAKFSAALGWWLPRLDDVSPALPDEHLWRLIRRSRAERGFDPRYSSV